MLGRLLETRHPFLRLICSFLNLNCFFNPKCTTDLDPFTIKACNLLKKDRDLLWSSTPMQTCTAFLNVIRHSEIGDLLNPNGKTSIPYFIIRRSGISKVKDLSEVNLNSLSRYLSPEKLATIKLSRRLNTPCPDILDCVTINNTFKKIKNSTSKEIRSGRMPKEPLTTFKIGTTITVSESLTLFYQISKLSNTKHKNSLLRALHGEL